MAVVTPERERERRSALAKSSQVKLIDFYTLNNTHFILWVWGEISKVFKSTGSSASGVASLLTFYKISSLKLSN